MKAIVYATTIFKKPNERFIILDNAPGRSFSVGRVGNAVIMIGGVS